MIFTVCTEYPIENVKSQVIWIEQLPYFIKISYANHKSKPNLIRKCTPYMDAITRYSFNCKGDSF